MNITDELTEDIKIGEDFNIIVGDSGDLETATGKRRIEQSVAISLREEVRDLVGSRVTGTKLNELRQAIRVGLRSDPDVDRVERVSIDKVDRQNDTVEWSAQVDGRNIHGIS